MIEAKRSRSFLDKISGQIGMGMIGQGYSQLVTIGVQLLVLPVMLVLWGAERYGSWLVITALPTYLAMADLGFAQIAANEMTMKLGRGERDATVDVNQTAWLMIGSAGIFVLIAYALFVWLVPIAAIFNIAGNDNAALATFLLSLVIVTDMGFGVVGAGLRATKRYPVLISTNATLRAFDALVLVAVAAMGFGFVVVAAAMLLLRVSGSTAVAIWFYRREPYLRPGLKRAKPALLRSMLAPSLAYMTYTISNALTIQGTTLLVGAIVGATGVVIVTAIRTLTRFGRQAASILSFPLEPVFARLVGKGDKQSFHRLFRRLMQAGGACLIVFLLGMGLLGEPFLSWWTKNVVTGETLFFRLMLIATAVEVLWFLVQTPFVATNRHSVFAMHVLMASVVGLAVLWFLLPVLGIAAVGWVSLATSLYILLATTLLGWRLALFPAGAIGQAA